MDSLPAILLLLAASVFAVVMLRRIGMPSILGYLLVGILLGPHVLDLVDDNAGIRHLAEFGIVFLMFSIGLEFSLPKLYAMKRIVFGLGLLQVILSMVLIAGLAMLLGVSWQLGIALGGDFAMSSTAVLTKLLAERLHAHGGSISAEHGIGLVKKPYLSSTRSEAEIALMRGIKAALDPAGIMNPGKVFD